MRTLACAGLLLVPCAAAAQQQPSQPRPSVLSLLGRPSQADPEQAMRDSVVALARSQVGRRYLFGGTDPLRGFDCSGFTRYLMRALGVQLPRTAAEQARVGNEVPRDPSRLRPGDILTFGQNGRVTHVGVYVGDGKYIHASTSAGRIIESRLDRPQSSLVRAWYGVRRFLSGDSATAVATTRPARSRERS